MGYLGSVGVPSEAAQAWDPSPPSWSAEAMIEVEGEKMRDKTWVLFEEVRAGGWTIGGKVPQLPPIGE